MHNAKKLGVELLVSVKEVDFESAGNDCPLPHVSTRLAADAKFLQSFTDWASRTVRPTDATVLLLPPIFPNQKVFDQVQTKLGLATAELLCVGEPTAGYRLQAALSAALSRQSVLKIALRSIDKIDSEGDQLRALEYTSSANTKERIEGTHFLLCTGKFFGGGISFGYEQVRETALNLPLFLPNEPARIKLRSETELRESPFQSAQGWSAMGVKINSAWQPIDESNQPVFKNVRACGSVIGGIDFAYSQVGLGFMACSGREAALVLS